MSIVATIAGLALTVLAYSANYADPSHWTSFYTVLVPSETSAGNWNMLVRVLAPILLLTGAWYLGEQIWARYKFNEMISAEKKSEFSKNIPKLEETARKLPKRYEEELKEKQSAFVSRR